MSDLEAGYYMCCVGCVVAQFAPQRRSDEVMLPRETRVAAPFLFSFTSPQLWWTPTRLQCRKPSSTVSVTSRMGVPRCMVATMSSNGGNLRARDTFVAMFHDARG